MDPSDRNSDIANFLSPSQRRAIASRNRLGPEPIRDRGLGAILYVDVSGFTPLAERLGRQGVRGAELLSRVIDGCFGRMSEIISDGGGEVVNFAGDALLAAWPVDSDRALDTASLLAAQTALAVQSELDRYEAEGAEGLRLRASVGAGTLELLEVGGVDDRRQFLTRGDSIVQAVGADRSARPGDVVVSASAWRRVAGRCRGVVLDSGDVKLEGVTRAVEVAPAPRPPHAIPDEEMRRHVPQFVRERLAAGHGEWMAEFRDATLLFVNLSVSGSEAPVEDVARLDEAVRVVQSELIRREGQLHQVMLDDKGTTLVAAFGLPPLAHEDDPARAVRAAIEIMGALGALGLRPSCGIASGRIWCGVYGTEVRRQYTVVGPAVNLAARLMQAADGGALCDARTADSAREAGVAFDAWPPIRLKGLPAPLPVFQPRTGSGAPAPKERAAPTPMVGRQDEFDLFRAAFAEVRAGGSGAVFVVEGEAGIGKSLMVREWTRHARRQGARVLVGEGDPVDSASAYYPWRAVFRTALGLASLGGDREEERSAVLRRLATRPDRGDLAPLLNAVVSLGFPETPRTRILTADLRASRTQGLLVNLLRETSVDDPTLIFLEDAHWFDSASWELALLVAHELGDVILVLTTRPEAPGLPGLQRILDHARARSIPLSALSPDQALAVACERLGVDEMPEAVADFIRDKAGGHPFHAEQLALALRESGVIRVGDGRCRLSADLRTDASSLVAMLGSVSGTLQGTIVSRIDRLPPDEQLALKVASVLGRSFASTALAAIHPMTPALADLERDLAAISARGLIRVESEEPGATHSFDHALTRDVVYESIPFTQRRLLHGMAGEWYERAGDDRPHLYPLLAHHWTRAEAIPKATHYLGRAGRHALDEHANEEAVRFLKAALDLEPGAAPPADGRRGVWSVQLGRAYVNWSRHSRGRSHLERGLEELDRRVPGSAPFALLGGIREAARQAIHRMLPDRFVGRGEDQAERLLQIARGYEALVEVYYLDGAKIACLYSALRALNVAETAGRSAELARGYATTGAILGLMKVHRAADGYSRRATEMADAVEDPGARAWACLSAGVYKAGLGAWVEATRLFEEAAALSETIEDRRRLDDSLMNLSTLSWIRGEFPRALVLADRCHESASRRRDARCRAAALRNRAACLVLKGERKLVGECIDEMEKLADPSVALRAADLVGLSAIRAWCECRLDNPDAASFHAENALKGLATLGTFYPLLIEYSALAEVYLSLWERARADGSSAGAVAYCRRGAKKVGGLLGAYARAFPIGRPASVWFRGRVEWLEGRTERANEHWRSSIADAQRLGMPYPEAVGHLELGQRGEPSDRRRHMDRAREILGRLGAEDLASADFEGERENG